MRKKVYTITFDARAFSLTISTRHPMLDPVVNMPEAKGQSVRIPADVLQMARSIVSVTDTTISDLIADTCRPVFRKELERLIKEGKFLPKPAK